MRASSDVFAALAANAAPPAPSSRIIAAEALRGVAAVSLGSLEPPPAGGPVLSLRDLDNEAARAAYALGRRRGFEQGARTGLQQGYSEGSQALEEFESRKAADLARQVSTLVESFRAEMQLLESQVASDLVSLAVDIARQVIRRELELQPESLLPVATEALRAFGEGASQLEVWVHPSDAQMLAEHLKGQPGVTGLKVHEDAGMARGGCRIEADTGVADATFEARWQAVMASLGREEEPLP
jgi:flagellar assembly protein FliH